MQAKAYLGIDVSKGYSDFVLLDGQCGVLEGFFQLNDTTAGRKSLGVLIGQWQRQGLEELYCGVESTGGYEDNWHSYLKGLQSAGGVFVSRLNAKAVKSVGDALLRRTVTDEVSATNIASYLAKFAEMVDYGLAATEPEGRFKEGRQFQASIRMWLKQKVQLGNQLEKLLYQHLPELLVYCRHGTPGWLLRLLVKYPTAAEIQKAGVGKMVQINGIVSGKAEAILKKLKDSGQVVGVATAHLIRVTATEVLHQQGLADSGKAYLSGIFKDDPSVKLLADIKGIGVDSAVAIVLEMEDVTRFATAKKAAAYFGLNPSFKQSGDGLWGNHMSKKGRGEIRAVLYMVALSAVRYNPLFKTLYARFRAQGMNHKQASGVVMHKMLRVIYGVLKSGKPFDPATEQRHREEVAKKQAVKQAGDKEQKQIKKSLDQEKIRFLTIEESAPVSGRNIKARKKRLASQTSTEVYTGSPTAEANI